MNFFQILVILVLSLLVMGSLAASIAGWTSRREGLLFSLLCLAACIATIWPDSTVKIANALGIGRGADLVFYSAVVAMMIGFWMIYIRLRHLRRQLTLLVRQLAILEGHKDFPPPQEPGSPA